MESGHMVESEHMETEDAASLEKELYPLLIGMKSNVMLAKVRNHSCGNVFAFLFGGFYFLFRRVYREGTVGCLPG